MIKKSIAHIKKRGRYHAPYESLSYPLLK